MILEEDQKLLFKNQLELVKELALAGHKVKFQADLLILEHLPRILTHLPFVF